MDDKWVAFGIIAVIILSVINAKNPNRSNFALFTVPKNNTQTTNNVPKGVKDLNDSKKYSDYIRIYNSLGYNANDEYIQISNNSDKYTVDITDFKLVSTSTGFSVSIPKTVKLYFTGMENVEENVILGPGEKAYIITGRSPIGYGMKINKCSGFLTQYNRFSPSFYTNCPRPKSEDLSSIPKTVNNDICFDLIDSYPSCRIQTTPLSNKYSFECQNFIYNKINYPTCITNHKNDSDFWGKEWFVYLNRSDTLWKNRRETIILYDKNGNEVSKIIKN